MLLGNEAARATDRAIELGLETKDVAVGAGCGKGLVIVVDLLTEEAAPGRLDRPRRARAAFSNVIVSPMRSCKVPSMVVPNSRAIGCTTP